VASTNIYLVRHGETDYNLRNKMQGRGIDAPLNANGRRQARAVAKYARELNIEQLYSSSMKRARETALAVGELCQLELVTHRDLDEMDFGELEGCTVDEIKPELQKLRKSWEAGELGLAAESGESPRMVLGRAAKRAEQIIREQHRSNLLFVLHGRLLRILLSHWLGFGLAQMHRIKHSNGAIYHLQWDGSRFESVYLHKTEHLKDVESAVSS